MLLFALACHSPGGDDSTPGPDPYDVAVGPYSVDVRWTAYGVPHILADDFGSLGYGMGYAFARDHVCVLADQVVRARSERSMYFGAGEDDANLNQDFGWLGLGVYRDAEAGFLSLPAEIQADIIGYAAGYDRYIADHAADLPDACRGADWVKPITHIDLFAYYLVLAENASGAVFVDAVGSAAPPSQARRSAPPPASCWTDARYPKIGSNGWALGRDKSADGSAMLMSNTHFPSEGELQWHESQLTIPGVMNVYGASLMGVPVINLGFNEDVAWTHTVSYTPRFTAVLLSLDPDNPLRYRYGDGWQDILAEAHQIQVMQADGSMATVSRDLYRSPWGPVLNAPALGWNALWAIALQDANAGNLNITETWLGFNLATSLDDMETAAKLGGVPWVHLLAADKTGEVLYADPGAAPNWSPEAEARYPEWLQEQPVAALFDDYGAITVDGSDPVFEWVEEPGTRVPGLVPYEKAPKVRRTDFVLNANDNYWMPNPQAPLTGAPYLFGAVETPRAARTRMNLRFASETGPGTGSGEDGKFTLDELEGTILSGRGVIAEEVRADVVARCAGADPVTIEGGPGRGVLVDVTDACATLAGWGGTVRLDDPGAVLWREFIGSGVFGWEDTNDGGLLFAVPFDPVDPVGTPRGLAPAPEEGADPVLEALARAAWQLGQVGFAVDATYRDTQFMTRGDARYPVPGATYWEGVIQIATYEVGNGTLLPTAAHPADVNTLTSLTTDGYQMNNGNSFVLTAELTQSGPHARALLTYSESEDPSSPHFADQTAAYGDERLRPVLFTEEEILADPALESLRLEREGGGY